MSNKITPKIAVITRTRDRPHFLKRALASVHAQTMQDFVHVIINDSGDPEVVEKIVNNHEKIDKSKIKIIHNSISHGVEAASNKAIKSVDSLYIAIHDDDDTWHQDFLKETTGHLDKTDSMGIVVTTDNIIEKISPSNNIIKLGQKRWMSHMREVSLYRQCLENQMTPITFVYKRSALDTVGYYDEKLIVCGDWDFGIRFMMHFDVDFLETANALAYYHHRDFALGVEGNSVFGEGGLDRRYINLLLNKYLREDINRGQMGIGYIMNDLRGRSEELHKIKVQLKELKNRAQKIEDTIIYRTSVKGFIKSNIDGVMKRVKR